MKKMLLIASALLAWVSILPAHAIVLGFNPVSSNVTQGSTIDIELTISELENGAAPSLGGFDISINFDDSLLGLTDVTFGDPTLGNQLDLFGFGLNSTGSTVTNNTVSLFELSFDTVDDLNLFQADSFTLATLSFNALSVGTSLLSISNFILSDALGTTSLSAETGSANITVLPVVSVPEPAMPLLLVIGLLAMRWVRGKHD